MNWYPCNHRVDRDGKRRAIAWACRSNHRLLVKHCGHPTANYPYYICIGTEEVFNEHGQLRTFRTLQEAQLAALIEADRRLETDAPGEDAAPIPANQRGSIPDAVRRSGRRAC